MKTYLVGGAVRDNLLNLKNTEQDYVVVGSTEKAMLELGYLKVGKDFPVFLHPKTKDEYALARTEKKTDKGYYGFKCDASQNISLEQDLLRRDLTINAMAMDDKGSIIDPYNGKKDLNNRILRHVSLAFKEDPLRVLRVARFKAKLHNLGFSIAPETLDLMRSVTPELSHLTPERIWLETLKALITGNPAEFFITLRTVGALKIIYPELDKLWGIPQNTKYHPEIDTGIHTMMALKEACKLTSDLTVRFSVLCHDLGKGLTPKAELPSHKGHEERGVIPIQELCKKNKVPNEFKDLAILVSRYHIKLHVLLNESNTVAHKAMDLLKSLDAFRRPENLPKFILACKADVRGREGGDKSPYPQGDFLQKSYNATHQIGAKQITGKVSGKELGEHIYQARVDAIDELFHS